MSTAKRLVAVLLMSLIVPLISWPAYEITASAATLTVDPVAGEYRTISSAAEKAKPGDAVIIKPGVYRESVHLAHSGSSQAPISFRAETPCSVVITGADPLTKLERLDGDQPIYR